MTEDEKLRAWAVEQAIKLHAANGVTTDTLLSEAKKLLEWVRPLPTDRSAG